MLIDMDKSTFLNRIDKHNVNGCWIWLGSRPIRYNKEFMTPQQLMWIINFGSVPQNQRVIRVCKNKRCVNPSHLKLSGTLSERIHSQIIKKSDSECWEFIGYKDIDGYGHSGYKHKDVLAHRFIYQEFYGIDPKELCVLHKCDNPSCCNPHHMFLGTTQDNTSDMVKKKRHAWGIRNGNAKLNESQVMEIRNKYQSGISTDLLAEQYNVTKTNIRYIVKGNIWSFLPVVEVN